MQQITKPIECLILDLFGVIVCFDDELVYERISQRCSDPHGAFARLSGLVSNSDLVRGRTSLSEIHRRLVKELELKSSYEEFQDIWQIPYSEPMPGMRDLLRQLSSQCQLILLSNVDKYYWPIVKTSIPELNDFSKLILSFENGIAKPEDESFSLAIAAAGVPTEKCFFVDDKSENIGAACQNGLRGHVFLSCRDLKSKLRKLGLCVK